MLCLCSVVFVSCRIKKIFLEYLFDPTADKHTVTTLIIGRITTINESVDFAMFTENSICFKVGDKYLFI